MCLLLGMMCDKLDKLDALGWTWLSDLRRRAKTYMDGCSTLGDHNGRAWCLEAHITMDCDQWVRSPCGHIGHAILSFFSYKVIKAQTCGANSCDILFGV
jgi:hypothetical protein